MLGIFLDFSKAFDTVKFEILLDKLYYYGIRGTPLKWFKNYLQNRSQYNNYHNVPSESLIPQTGVPQGSILGPLLGLVWFRGLTPQQQPGSYQGGEMMMKSVFWWRKPEHPEETTDLRQVTDETFSHIRLFSIYINDLYLITNFSNPIMFADNSSFFLSDRSLETIFNKVNEDLILIMNG